MSEISGIPAPETEPTIEIPLPNPIAALPTPPSEFPLVSDPSPPSSHSRPEIPIPLPDPKPNPSRKPTPSSRTLLSWAPLYLSKTDRVIERLSSIISTPAGTDSVLNTLCYSSLLVSVILRKVVAFQEEAVKMRAEAVIGEAVEGSAAVGMDVLGLLRGKAEGLGLEIGKVRREEMLDVAGRLKVLSGLISGIRTFLRLFGLVGLWMWGRGVLARLGKGEKGTGIAIESLQVVVNVCYQILENGAYLSARGVLGWDAKTQLRAGVWSSRFWGMHVGLDLIKLARQFGALQKEKRLLRGKEADEKKENEISLQEKQMHWRRQLAIDLAYAPLTVHWGLEEGLVSEAWVAIFGSVAGSLNLRERWRVSGL
ncbi:hypothetical protein HYFRA_00008808 [Hymenoscyphus fraxineus]|uniref:Peroxin 11C n=1 Tax=Hymenoscyphus fraxineus TaxID=746836 RepID=A0A9N9PJK9_9HELO|nr:hypothetical protein HYFRA_00008808 [Hymenoscyphus fraxineus]